LKYSLDTSGLLKGWKEAYPPDIFAALWQDIDGLIYSGDLIACEVVLQELEVGDDDVYQWARRPRMFVPLDADIQLAVNNILSHPEHCKLVKRHATRTDADPFVIATALVKDCAVISSEILMMSPSPHKTKIPNVCRDLGIRHLTFLEFIREQGWKYS
jgi:Domain of unknown function (DUF4411)